MRNPVQARMTSLLSLLLAVIVCRYGCSQEVDPGNCTTEATICTADEICNACIGELQGISDAVTTSVDTDCQTVFGTTCSAVDQNICDVTNELLVDLAGCLAEDQLGCSGFTNTTCAEVTGNTTLPTETPSPSSIGVESMAPTATTEAPTMMAPTATTEAPIMMAPVAFTGAPSTTTEGPSMGEDTETGSNAGASVSSTTAATTTLMGLALLVALFVVPGRLL